MSDSQEISGAEHGQRVGHGRKGVVRKLVGRRDGRGVPEMFHAEVLHDDEPMVIRMCTPRGEIVPVEPLQAHLRFIDFGMCPICLSSANATREHVPPASIGGRALTLTFEACNNIFGSRYEPALQDWHDAAVSSLRFSGKAVPGSRGVGRVLLRENERGEPVILMSGGAPGIRELLNDGNVQLEYTNSRGYEFRVAALKTAYLTCCLILGHIPDTPEAHQVRRELMAARNLPKGVSPTPSGKVASLRLTKTGQIPRPGEIHIIAARCDDDSMAYFLSFNRFWTISWPLEIGAFVLSDGDQHYVLGTDIPSRRDGQGT